MDFMLILSYVLAIVETAALIATLIYTTRVSQEKKLQRKNQGKKGSKSSEVVQKTVSAYYRNASIFFVIYLALNFLRRYSGIFE